MIAVTFALPAESSEFLKRLSNKSQSDRNVLSIVRGKIGGREVEVMHTGVGEKACRERLQRFLDDQKFDLLISSGFAGALTDDLRIGDLLLAKNFSTVDLGERWSSLSTLPIHVANLLTVPALIDSREERERVAHEAGASAVDMETESIARSCVTHGIPLVALRVITDTPTQPFPAPPGILFDVQQQRTQIATLAKFFLARPMRIPGLIQFAKRVARARKTLANALVAIVRAQVGAIDPNGPGRFG
jgi:adenosylhomocysteine nucleosidase